MFAPQRVAASVIPFSDKARTIFFPYQSESPSTAEMSQRDREMSRERGRERDREREGARHTQSRVRERGEERRSEPTCAVRIFLEILIVELVSSPHDRSHDDRNNPVLEGQPDLFLILKNNSFSFLQKRSSCLEERRAVSAN